MTAYYLTIGLAYLVVGFGVALFFYFVLRKSFLGNFWGALLIGLIGAFAGGLVDFLFSDIIGTLANLNNSVNIFPPVITAFILVWLFSLITDTRDGGALRHTDPFTSDNRYSVYSCRVRRRPLGEDPAHR
jgi:uncharacterized membrane protein YeaQ/YmgE (transglycosylase-associated protein family)